jgi:hypothetical protein
MDHQGKPAQVPAEAVARLQELVEQDEARMRETRAQARAKLPVQMPGSGSIVGGPLNDVIRELGARQWQTIEHLLVESFHQKLEFQDVGTRGAFDDEPVESWYAVKLPGVHSHIEPDDTSTIVSWTNPIVMKGLDHKTNAVMPIHLADGRQRRYKVLATAQYEGRLLPNLAAATYAWDGRKVSWSDREELDLLMRGNTEAWSPRPGAATRAKVRHRADYVAEDVSGLGEIIALADKRQRASVQLPYDRHVIIEGPPGSGKTSIALMRIAVLIDQQHLAFDEVDRTKPDTWRYDAKRTRVLVRSSRMRPYLEKGLANLKIRGVAVEHVAQFLRRRAGDLIAGGSRQEEPSLTRIKALPQALDVVWAAFRATVQARVAEARWLEELEVAGGQRARVAAVVRSWSRLVEQTPRCRDKSGRPALPPQIDLATRLAPSRGVPEVADDVRRALTLVPKINRLDIARSGSAQANALGLAAAKVMDADDFAKAMRVWQSQATRTAGHSEADVALAATLAAAMGRRDERPLTHVVVDEAQDLTPAEALAVRQWLDPRGLITAVGDLRQMLGNHGGLSAWNELNLPRARRAAFRENYRQSWDIGRFVQHLHRRLFGEEPVWKPSTRRKGGLKPRLLAVPEDAAEAVALEVVAMRKDVPGATVAVVFDDAADPMLLEVLDALDNAGIAADNEPGESIVPGQVLLLGAEQTKGLEFDGVVIAGSAGTMSRRLGGPGVAFNELPMPQRLARNRLYVAASRARQCLAIVTKQQPKLLAPLLDARICQPG